MDKRKIAIGVLAIGIVACLSGGAIYAWFSDTESAPGNTITAGELNLAVNGEDEWSTPWNLDGVPGSIEYGTIQLTNIGNVPGTVSFTISDIADSENGINEPEADAGDNTPDVGELSNYMTIGVWIDADNDGVLDDGETVISTDFTGIEDVPQDIAGIILGEGDSVYLGFWVEVDENADNTVQTDATTFTLTFTLNQVQN